MTIDLKKIFASEHDVDPKIHNALIRALKDAHQDGFDYLKFKQSVINMMNMDMDETTSIKSAYATASTMGLTKTKLVSSTKHYKNILSKEKQSFAEAMRKQLAEKVEGKRTQTEKLAKKIEDYKIKIQKMRDEMALYQQKIDNVDEEVAKAKAKIEATRDKFQVTYDSVEEILLEDMAKIDRII